MKTAPEGSFLLNGIGAAPKKPMANGYLSVRGNGVAPGVNQPTSEYELSSTCKAETREEVTERIIFEKSFFLKTFGGEILELHTVGFFILCDFS